MRLSRGFSLMEVLVSILILSIGILGVAALQLSGLQFSQSSYQTTQATAVVGDLIDRMRTTPAIESAAVRSVYTFDTTQDSQPTDPGCTSSGCNAEQLAQHNVRHWWDNVLPLLGSEATAEVTRNGDVYTVTINWVDHAESDQRSFVTEVRL
jgi:type IV pilus assembly protein PilV